MFQKCVAAQEIQLEQISCSWTRLDILWHPSLKRFNRSDNYEGVRFEALTILNAMAETDPEYQVEVDTGASRSVVGGQTIRLVDDVFSRTCQGACEGTGGPADRGYEGREPGLPRAHHGQEADEQNEAQEECTWEDGGAGQLGRRVVQRVQVSGEIVIMCWKNAVSKEYES